ncbi:tRNA (adenosine(37)-N6)-threonylcarbamoyltransferase complex ATPase subunit type 1 TsaE [Sutterella wadsworthensis]|uniref:tRNA (adenosine(37)-N6)-threonylcarbamoyltransferase complex ATPase subunit type 1 TsaE n=1 Tax=Sutterella wadsworthensis TaxID=40545 RepID=UPI003AB94EBB
MSTPSLFTVELPLPDDTDRLGAALADVLIALRPQIDASESGLAMRLEGDLGAGKTSLVRAMLRRLGWTGAVKSPTFTLRDWARAWRAGKFRTTISPHLYRYSDAVKRKAVRMRQKGHTWHEIAEATGVGASTCKRWMDKLGQSASKGRTDEIRP